MKVKTYKLFPVVFFGIFLLIGLLNFNKYGISWDEPMQRDMGLLCYDYVTGKRADFFNIQNKYHNATWELINVLPEKWLNLTSGRSIYYSRHLLNFLIFWTGAIYLFLLAQRIVGNWRLSLLGIFILILTPRIYAHGFYNSKDIPFLSFFVISMYYGIGFIQKPGARNLLLLSLFSGALFGMRILGIMVPFLVVIFFMLNILNGNLRLAQLKWLGLYVVLYPLFVYLCVPVLWPDPIFHVQEAFKMMSHFPYDDPVLFMGQYIKPADLPWYYVPVWIGISVPILWTVLFLSGTAVSFIDFIQKPGIYLKLQWKEALLIIWIFTPWLMVIILGSHIYDEWRHLFFTYPAMILMMLVLIKKVIVRIPSGKIEFLVKTFFYGAFTWQILATGYFMIKNNPHQFVYFNDLAGKNIHLRYEMDYWGLSYRYAWEYLIYELQEDPVIVQYETPPGLYNLAWFTEEELKKLTFTDYLSCKYFVTNYRFHPVYDYTEKVYSLTVDGLEIMTIFKNPKFNN